MTKYKDLFKHDSRQKIGEDIVNGTVTPLWSVHEGPPFDVRFIYATTVSPGTVKGPYCHTRRNSMLCVLIGHIVYIHRGSEEGEFQEEVINSNKQPVRIDIPANEQHCFIGLGDQDSFFVNICDYAWKQDDDEVFVPDFSLYDFGKWLGKDDD